MVKPTPQPMKTQFLKFSTLLVAGLVMIMTIFITRPGNAQEPAKKDSKKIIKINVVTQDNGKMTVVDTTMELPDSASIDSVRDEIEKVIAIGHSGKHARVHCTNAPREFSYQFEMPDIPEMELNFDNLRELENLEGLEGMEDCVGFNWESPVCSPECKVMRIGREGGQSLNDLLGDIPMSRVKSYSIKDTRHGKRIVIDLENGPIVENRNKVIVIRNGSGYSHQPKMKVIKKYSGSDMNESPEAPDAPPPPPPPPPAEKKQEKPKSGAPKI
jgi:hypothetical protein